MNDRVEESSLHQLIQEIIPLLDRADSVERFLCAIENFELDIQNLEARVENIQQEIEVLIAEQ